MEPRVDSLPHRVQKTHTCSRATADGPKPPRWEFSEEDSGFSEVMLGFVELLVCMKTAHMLVGGGIRPDTESSCTRGCCTTHERRREATVAVAAWAVSDYQGTQRRSHAAVSPYRCRSRRDSRSNRQRRPGNWGIWP